ncbi:hypothetical protein BTO20_06030 [Mycobacterium dioxanotrophicus]|jgi:hypothetical protein|uniref:Holin n=1 Tax=Mycobacterium dioxanotrophicus TaxID=482462 RepID=A0A1Y0BZ72_9MYCO|nr:hypothetical protein [Mycobacterium dioxanotrophicus]ART68198.1 hypothetical protein BTO20_06030 [Mycobacterium dioxanotrophicus]
MRIGKYKPSQIRKAAVAGVGVVGTLATSAVDVFTTWIPAGWAGPIASGIAFVAAIGVFLTKNAPLIDAVDEL